MEAPNIRHPNDVNALETNALRASKEMDDVFERTPLGKLSPACQESCSIPGAGCGRYLQVPLNTSIDPDMPDDELKRRAKILKWVHDIELRPGIRTKQNSRDPSAIWEQSHIVNTFPDVKGKTVLELGSWNGKWGFLAEDRGAAHVTMTDFVCWGRGPTCKEREQWLADPNYPYTNQYAAPCGMRAPFDLARAVRRSKVTAIEIDPFDISKRNLGRCFDVVLYPGILYHVFNQEAQLSRIYDVMCEGATVYVEGPDAGHDINHVFNCATHHCDSNTVPWGAFVNYQVEGNNKWFMSVQGVTDLLKSMGFEEIKVLHTGARAVHTARRLAKQTCKLPDCTDAAHPHPHKTK